MGVTLGTAKVFPTKLRRDAPDGECTFRVAAGQELTAGRERECGYQARIAVPPRLAMPFRAPARREVGKKQLMPDTPGRDRVPVRMKRQRTESRSRTLNGSAVRHRVDRIDD